jgi:hypothetical protein
MEDLYSRGWRQGAVLDVSLPASWLVLGQGGVPESATEVFSRWVVCSQDCDLRAATCDSKETQIEIRPVLDVEPPLDWGIRSRRIRLTESDYVNSASPRLLITAELLASLRGPALLLSDARAKAFKTWLGLRYDRAAIPERLVPLAREVATRCGTRGGRAAAEEVHEVLMQFNESTSPPEVALFAVVGDTADKQEVRDWLSGASLRINTELGVVSHIDVATKPETSLALIENSYAADLSQLTWGGQQPTGAE